MRRIVLVITLAALLAGCGGASAPAAPVEPAPEIAPTVAPDPTLTPSERQDVTTISERTKSMISAANELQQLGQEIRATVAWKGKVKAAVSVITGGQKVIQSTALPSWASPVTARAKSITDACAAAAASLPDSDALSIAAVAAIQPQLERCATDLDRLQLSLITFQ